MFSNYNIYGVIVIIQQKILGFNYSVVVSKTLKLGLNLAVCPSTHVKEPLYRINMRVAAYNTLKVHILIFFDVFDIQIRTQVHRNLWWI